MVRHNRDNDTPPGRRLSLPAMGAVVALLLPTTFGWSPSPLPPSPRRTRTLASDRVLAPLASTAEPVDDTYYSPVWSDGLESPLFGGTPRGKDEADAAGSEEGAASSSPSAPSSSAAGAKVTLTRWLSAKVQDYPELRDMESLHLSIQMACKTISNLIHSSSYTADGAARGGNDHNPRDDSMKRESIAV